MNNGYVSHPHIDAPQFMILATVLSYILVNVENGNPLADLLSLIRNPIRVYIKWTRGRLVTAALSVTATVNSRYLEVRGTVWNNLRYPYLDISDLQKWGKINWTASFLNWICNLTPKVGHILKILRKKRRNCSLGAISPLFHIILLPVFRFVC